MLWLNVSEDLHTWLQFPIIIWGESEHVGPSVTTDSLNKLRKVCNALLKGWSWELNGAFLLQLQAFLSFFLFLILTRLLVRIKGTNVPFHSLPKPCLPTQLEPSKMPDQIIPWEKYYDDSQVRKALRSVGSVWILADTAVSILTDCICLWPPDSSAAVTGLDWNTGNTRWVSAAHWSLAVYFFTAEKGKKINTS